MLRSDDQRRAKHWVMRFLRETGPHRRFLISLAEKKYIAPINCLDVKIATNHSPNDGYIESPYRSTRSLDHGNCVGLAANRPALRSLGLGKKKVGSHPSRRCASHRTPPGSRPRTATSAARSASQVRRSTFLSSALTPWKSPAPIIDFWGACGRRPADVLAQPRAGVWSPGCSCCRGRRRRGALV